VGITASGKPISRTSTESAPMLWLAIAASIALLPIVRLVP